MARDHAVKLTRRALAPALVGLTLKGAPRIEGGFALENVEQGHLLRDRAPLMRPRESERVPVVIVGGGMAGLSAAWWMERQGFRDFRLLEMENEAGGNARGGENEVSAYPWAAHYVPVPDTEAGLVRELFTELGLLRDGVWDERWLCHAPKERLFIHGRWEEGVEPHAALTGEERRQMERFATRMEEYRETGRFTVPMERGVAKSTAAEQALDRITMGEWMRREGLTSAPVRWLADYSTRDDYGTRVDDISAWAGIHYFAARQSEEKGPLTWPEGNAWVTRRLATKLRTYVRNNSMVFRVERAGVRWRVFTQSRVYEADCVVWAAPTWLASWVVDPPPPRWVMDTAPWLVSNLTLERWPRERGYPPCWDNVIYRSPSLGYVVATHQNVARHQERTVWTHYWALADGRGADQRRLLLGGDWHYWSEKVLADLERAHPDIRQCVSRIDIFRIAHAMPRPLPGVMFDERRQARLRPRDGFAYANCDLSALSLFEEAQYRGVEAAKYALGFAGRGR
ncbi:MAG: FAD-dependent oxidoreductase [Bryobacteraceae bacterium]|nr:FAD-dependent oxidoreductase [Bryobacteraceae bacterium]